MNLLELIEPIKTLEKNLSDYASKGFIKDFKITIDAKVSLDLAEDHGVCEEYHYADQFIKVYMYLEKDKNMVSRIFRIDPVPASISIFTYGLHACLAEAIK